MSRCDICIEEDCKGKKNCNCDKCKNLHACNKVLRTTIRITTKCPQSCKHCCFRCSPTMEDMMTVEMAKNISIFLLNNNIKNVNLMGGEFFMNPDWYDIIELLVKNVSFARLVSNGDWVENKEISEKVKKIFAENNNLHMSLSKDKWHTNKNVDSAIDFCQNNKIPFNVATEDQVENNSIVPIGRGEESYNMYSMFLCYCHKPDNKYSFMIDESGNIFKCSFGVWDYANIDEYLNGGFAERFKEFNKTFYSVFLSNCMRCNQQYLRAKHKSPRF